MARRVPTLDSRIVKAADTVLRSNPAYPSHVYVMRGRTSFWAYVPQWGPPQYQDSNTWPTWQQAVDAIIDGYEPERLASDDEIEE
jgi:hypothetical protein